MVALEHVPLVVADGEAPHLFAGDLRGLQELAGQRVLARVDGPLDETVELTRPVTVADLLTFTMGF